MRRPWPELLSFFPGNFTLGLEWDVTNGHSIDLDASCVYLDEGLQPIDTVDFAKLQSDDGALVHSGDERVGDAAGDDESIRVRAKLPLFATHLFILTPPGLPLTSPPIPPHLAP